MDSKLAVLKYHNSFADNFSTYAYGKILANKFSHCCVYENSVKERSRFESDMDNFNLDYTYVSKTRVDKIYNRKGLFNLNELHSKNINSDRFISYPHYNIKDIGYINSDIKKEFEFKNLDFIRNYDILEEINASNSIGLYINKSDSIDKKFIEKSFFRLNKYIKRPFLYIFCANEIKLNYMINYKRVSLNDWREEFYFLRKCKHKIIHCSKNSYSEGFWASILGNNDFSYVTYDKRLQNSYYLNRWLKV